MTRAQRRSLEMCVRARGCGATHRALVADGAPGGQVRSIVTKMMAAIDTLLVAQVVAVGDTRWRTRGRAAIARVFLSIARTARQMARIDGRVERTSGATFSRRV